MLRGSRALEAEHESRGNPGIVLYPSEVVRNDVIDLNDPPGNERRNVRVDTAPERPGEGSARNSVVGDMSDARQNVNERGNARWK